ncbi:globin domain-containing protein [Micromonospora sp. NBC_01813]|uniref:globin domain-containing protein n=1 Tax=Micromonospora sp. NBC_01813 TaxID=2975988 RepID=UPI002DD9349B|nr:globin domain-containing protein [Micromonospora sp. NBC_01813]WSA07269.1 globin domain-containing protein [Micromonospora sp. NBC_01813]
MSNLAQLLKESWVLVEEQRDEVAGYFYARLFYDDPALRQLFPVHMDTQRRCLVEAIVTAVGSIDDPEQFDDYLQGLGRAHRKFQVQPAHYASFGAALLEALRTVAADQWTIEYEQAWSDALELLTGNLILGAQNDPNPAFWHAEVLSHERRGTDIAVLTCRPLQHPLEYQAGQYVSVEAPRYQPRLWRTYSIANAPRTDNVLEFHVRAAGAGWVSSALVRRVRPGDLLRVAAPMGTMVLDRDSPRDIVCLAGGVGLAPVKALVDELTRFNRSRWVHVYFGGRTRDDLYDLAELNRLAAAYPWLNVVPCCADDPTWSGEHGEVSQVLARYGPWHEHDFFVSGSASMVRASLRTLAELDIPADRIRYDSFGEM